MKGEEEVDLNICKLYETYIFCYFVWKDDGEILFLSFMSFFFQFSVILFSTQS